MDKRRKPAFRFTAAADVALLKEVIVLEPYSAPHGEINKRWQTIVKNVGELYSAEAARKRFASILAEFKSENADQIRS